MAAAPRARLKAKLGRLNSTGIDPEMIITTALLDRLKYHCHFLETGDESICFIHRTAEAKSASRPASRPARAPSQSLLQTSSERSAARGKPLRAAPCVIPRPMNTASGTSTKQLRTYTYPQPTTSKSASTPGFISSPSKEEKRSGANRSRLVDSTGEAVISLDWNGDKKVWLLTFYEKGAEAGTTMDTASNGSRGDTARLGPDAGKTVAPAAGRRAAVNIGDVGEKKRRQCNLERRISRCAVMLQVVGVRQAVAEAAGQHTCRAPANSNTA